MNFNIFNKMKWKGIIKAADDRSVRIELAAKCRII